MCCTERNTLREDSRIVIMLAGLAGGGGPLETKVFGVWGFQILFNDYYHFSICMFYAGNLGNDILNLFFQFISLLFFKHNKIPNSILSGKADIFHYCSGCAAFMIFIEIVYWKQLVEAILTFGSKYIQYK
jgi:hypothetical protein